MTTLDTCRLNDMIPMRADVHQLFDAFEVGIDVHDNNRIVSFSKERSHFSDLHLNLDDIPGPLRPLPELLTDHLSQGVSLHCLLSKYQHASHQKNGLSTVIENLGTPESTEGKEMYEVMCLEEHVISHLQQLSFKPTPGSALANFEAGEGDVTRQILYRG